MEWPVGDLRPPISGAADAHQWTFELQVLMRCELRVHLYFAVVLGWSRWSHQWLSSDVGAALAMGKGRENSQKRLPAETWSVVTPRRSLGGVAPGVGPLVTTAALTRWACPLFQALAGADRCRTGAGSALAGPWIGAGWGGPDSVPSDDADIRLAEIPFPTLCHRSPTFDDCQIHADNMRADYIAPVLSGIASLQNYAQQWYLDKGLTWPAQPPVNKIDVHHHMVPDFYAKGACVSYVRRPS